MGIRDFIRQYLPDSYETQAIRATVREMEELRSSVLGTNLVEEAYRDHLANTRLYVSDLNSELRALAGQSINLADVLGTGVMPLETSSILTAARELAASSDTYFSYLAEQLSPHAAVLRGLANLDIPRDYSGIIAGLGVEANFLGEFSYELSEDRLISEPSEKEQSNDEVTSRLVEVNWFPVLLFEELRRNPELMKGLDDRRFEEFCAELLDRTGFEKIQLTPRSGDGGRDVIAIKTIHGIPIMLAFECKRYKDSRKIGLGIMRSLLGSVSHSNTMVNKGVLLTTSSFTSGSKSFIAQEPRVDGRDFAGLVEWIKSSSPA